MAIINIKNATVGAPLGDKGFNLIENFTKKDGTSGASYYKVWTEQSFSQGAVIDVSGLLSVVGQLYEGEARVSVSINNAKITQAQAQNQAVVAAEDSPF